MRSCFAPLTMFSIFVLCSSSVFAEQKPFAPESIPSVVILSAEEVVDKILLDADLIVIDSRKKEEYVKGHIEGAVNILNTQLNAQYLERIAPSKSLPVLFYCNGVRCLRSSDSINMAKNWGYSNLFWFRGGWKEWTKKNLPVATD